MSWLSLPSALASSPGKNGSRTITAPNTVVNQFTTLTAAVSPGASTITVFSAAALNSPEPVGGGALTAGDVILIYQARGASIDTANTTTYGNITSYGNAGHYEFQSVASVSGNVITLAPLLGGPSCTTGAIKRSYSAGAQVIRVPQYSSLTVNSGASIVSNAWNGDTGGVVALHVQNTLTVNGTISVSGLGFRGGITDDTDASSGIHNTITFAVNNNPAGGSKGEGIASGAGGTFGGVSLPFSNPGGNFDMAAPANGGGGGGSHNAGGGGGANAAASLTPYCTNGTATFTVAIGLAITWCGQGVMPSNVTGSAAWTLDPGYLANGNALTQHVGGGRGGYTYSNSNQNALTLGPGQTLWGGHRRKAFGGWGGRPLAQDLQQRVFFGGGGGAGGMNNNSGSAGGAGGGIIFIDAGTLAGTGAIQANGNTAANTSGGHNDAPGGGGAGGSIIVRASSGSVGSFRANGGNGGNQLITNNEAEGPGGGGGGGIIAVSSGIGGAQQANAGTGGTTTSSALTEFPRNGSTDGSSGLTGQTPPQLIFPLIRCAGLSISKSSSPTGVIDAGSAVTYTITIANSGPDAADGSLLRDPAVTGLSCSAITCTSAIGTSCAASLIAGSVTMANLQGSGIPIVSFPANSTINFALTCGVTATGVP